MLRHPTVAPASMLHRRDSSDSNSSRVQQCNSGLAGMTRSGQRQNSRMQTTTGGQQSLAYEPQPPAAAKKLRPASSGPLGHTHPAKPALLLALPSPPPHMQPHLHVPNVSMWCSSEWLSGLALKFMHTLSPIDLRSAGSRGATVKCSKGERRSRNGRAESWWCANQLPRPCGYRAAAAQAGWGWSASQGKRPSPCHLPVSMPPTTPSWHTFLPTLAPRSHSHQHAKAAGSMMGRG